MFFLLCYTTIFIWVMLFVLVFLLRQASILKDAIFENLVVSSFTMFLASAIFMQVLASMFTAALFCTPYFIQFFLVLLCGRRQDYERAHESSSYFFVLPLMILSFFSIFIGYLSRVSFYWFQVLLFLVSSILNLLLLCYRSRIYSST